MIPRHVWLRERTQAVVNELSRLYSIDDYDQYRELALELSIELNYAVCQWGEYYRDEICRKDEEERMDIIKQASIDAMRA